MNGEKKEYCCPKCGCHSFEDGQFHAAGSTMMKFLDVQNKKFITISCVQCGYTEIYKDMDSSTGMNILDLLIGG